MEFSPLSVPVSVKPAQLLSLVRALLKERDEDDEDEEGSLQERPILFFVQEQEITESLKDTMAMLLVNRERAVPVVYKPQSVFRVRPVTRCTASMPGHSQPVVAALFSGDGRRLATASGDRSVRLWDVETQTPNGECKDGHNAYVLALAWAPDHAGKLAAGE